MEHRADVVTVRQQLRASAATVPATGRLVRPLVTTLAVDAPRVRPLAERTAARELDAAWLYGPCDPEGNPILHAE